MLAEQGLLVLQPVAIGEGCVSVGESGFSGYAPTILGVTLRVLNLALGQTLEVFRGMQIDSKQLSIR